MFRWIRYVLIAIPTLAFAGETPPLDENGWFANEGDCPFECCTYREWHVEQDTPILSKPFGTEAIGTARAGETIDGITGVVFSKPVLVKVIKDYQVQDGTAPSRAGDEFYLLAHMGEGYVSAWYRGSVVGIDAFALFSETDDSFDNCDPASDSCWWSVEPGSHLEYDWWAKVRLPDGTEGWARPDNFGNIDACG